MRGSGWQLALGALLVVMPLVLGTLPTGAAPTGTGSITGRVIDGAGTPLAGMCAQVENGPTVQTDATGTYTIAGLDAGSYKVDVTDCTASPTFVEQWYSGHPDASSADSVQVNDGMDTPIGDMMLAPGVSVTGQVIDTNGAPLSGITVELTPTDPGPSKVGVTTGVDGTYATSPLAPGGYQVHFIDQSPDPVWAPQYWKQATTLSAASTLKLTTGNGPVVSDVNAQLSAAAVIEGTVQGPGGSGLDGICIDANIPNGNGSDWIARTVTDADGRYAIDGLPATDIRVHFHGCNGGPYLDQWYDTQAGYESSTPVVLAAGDDRTGIDAQLSQGTEVAGQVTDTSGNPIAGIAVNVNSVDGGSSVGARTDASGKYRTSGLPPGTYRVQFRDGSSPATWASQFWSGRSTPTAATVLTVSGSDILMDHIDATLVPGATVTGRVTSAGSPVGNVCVSAEADATDGTDWLDGATTGPDGTYAISGLPAIALKVHFRGCGDDSHYVEQWWDHAATNEGAKALTLTPGSTRTGIDAALVAAGSIRGRVTDRAGNPLQGISAQATTSSFVGGLSSTNDQGLYTIDVAKPGSYLVQFVDCSGSHRYAGQWWNNQPGAASAQPIAVTNGQVVMHVDAKLARGAAGTISGKVVNFSGTAMTSVCVIAFLPNQFALFGAVQSDGTYTVPDVPSGTYALAFLGCEAGDPSPVVQDPRSPATSYPAVWWKGAKVTIKGQQGGPDPIAQGATLVTVKPGHDLAGYDWCFGCTAITITSITPANGSLTVAFATPGLLSTVGASSLSARASARSFTRRVHLQHRRGYRSRHGDELAHHGDGTDRGRVVHLPGHGFGRWAGDRRVGELGLGPCVGHGHAPGRCPGGRPRVAVDRNRTELVPDRRGGRFDGTHRHRFEGSSGSRCCAARARSRARCSSGGRGSVISRRGRSDRAHSSDLLRPLAFCACFHARTRANASRESMSATERGDSSPNGVASCSQPAARTTEPLPQDREEDLGLLVSVAGQRPEPVEEHLGVVNPVPDLAGVAVVGVDDHLAQRLRPLGHRTGVPVQRRLLAERIDELVRGHRRDACGVEPTESFGEGRGPTKRPLHRYLLIEEHADQEGEGVVDEQLVRGRVTGDGERDSSHRRSVFRSRTGVRVPPRRSA